MYLWKVAPPFFFFERSESFEELLQLDVIYKEQELRVNCLYWPEYNVTNVILRFLIPQTVS